MTSRRALWILIVAVLIIGGAPQLAGDGGECGWDEARHTSGECVPCPYEATPESPCMGLVGDEL